MSEVRSNFHRENTSSELLEEHISFMQTLDCKSAEPYLACAIMQRAEHSNWPLSQLKYFNQGKERLEKYISAHKDDIEARYVRLLVQQGSPSFLGYRGDISDDANYILDNLYRCVLPEWLKVNMKNAANENLN